MPIWLKFILIWLLLGFLLAITIGKLISRHQRGKCGCPPDPQKPRK